MARLIMDTECGSLSTALLFGEPSRALYDFIGQQYATATTALSESALRWAEKTRGVFEKIGFDDAMRSARAAVLKLGQLGQYSGVMELTTMEAMQAASPMMQTYIMANPMVRQLWLDGGCDGYSGSYRDNTPLVGEAHYVYRRVMDGVVVDNPDGTWEATTYLEELIHERDELHLEQQKDVLRTWARAEAALRAKMSDPTSSWNGTL